MGQSVLWVYGDGVRIVSMLGVREKPKYICINTKLLRNSTIALNVGDKWKDGSIVKSEIVLRELYTTRDLCETVAILEKIGCEDS
jgi:hypothetical protein